MTLSKEAVRLAKVRKVEKLLDWMLNHNQEDRRVTVGCKTCHETTDLLAATAKTAWLCFHRDAPMRTLD